MTPLDQSREADVSYASTFLEQAAAGILSRADDSRTPPKNIWSAGRRRHRRRVAASISVLAASLVACGFLLYGFSSGPFRGSAVAPAAPTAEEQPEPTKVVAADPPAGQAATLAFTRNAPLNVDQISLNGKWYLEPILVEPKGASATEILGIESTDYALTFDQDRLYTDAGHECSGIHGKVSQISSEIFNVHYLYENMALCRPEEKKRGKEWSDVIQRMTDISITDNEALFIRVEKD